MFTCTGNTIDSARDVYHCETMLNILPTSQISPLDIIITIYSLLILQAFHHFTYVTTHSPTLPSLYLRHSSSNPFVASPTSQFIPQPFFSFSYVTSSSHNEQSKFILQTFRHFTYLTAHSPTLPSLYLCHSSFSNPSVASPKSQFILQPLFRFSYISISSLNERSSFSKLSVTSPTSQIILHPFRRITYVTAPSPTLPLLPLRHSSSHNPSVVYPTSQALHLMSRAHSPNFPSLHLLHRSFSNPSVALSTS